MKKLLIKLFRKPVLRLAEKFSSRPDKERVFASLTELHSKILNGDKKKGLIIPFNAASQKIIVFSDQHKGARNKADDFAICEQGYVAALDYYFKESFSFINLGDGEELWENNIFQVKKHNRVSFEKEKLFIQQKRFIKIFGNHDLYWANDPLAWMQLESIYGEKVPVYEGCILATTLNKRPFQIYLTHGHQGDLQSDGNWFSKWFVSTVWGPVQGLLDINPNTPAFNDQLKSLHNTIMYEWSNAEKNVLLITGHTHQPVFMSLTHLERLYVRLAEAQKNKDDAALKTIEGEIAKAKPVNPTAPDFSRIIPSYFNSGCCCFDDGDITGIEIADGYIRLIKWQTKNNVAKREVLEEIKLNELEGLLS
ncbi:metallophosphoesterase [Parafilimonas sp.]|uniref:metallophosphoesterase n=1 Tax=Parafilimonas sp. TaxID=1969739 RepID=UPI0039E4914D